MPVVALSDMLCSELIVIARFDFMFNVSPDFTDTIPDIVEIDKLSATLNR
jgi:hypothetical protein